MTNLRELLREADPLLREGMCETARREVRRRTMLAAASGVRTTSPVPRSRIFALTAVWVIAIATTLFMVRSDFFVGNVLAAVRFEVRLAEDKPAPGLHEAKVPDSKRSIYLHDEVIVSNSDIASAQVVRDEGSSQYAVSIEFNSSGAEKMRAATGAHIGEHVAILLDGEVVMVPVLRSPITDSAKITGRFTRAQAERIVDGIKPR